jgi:hypothetical protein
MTEPRELTYLVPVQVLAEVQNAVAMLERHRPLVCTLDVPGQDSPADVTPDGPWRSFRCYAPWRRGRPRSLPRPGASAFFLVSRWLHRDRSLPGPQ